jgi:16S rRNA processing protein RimM
MPESSHAAPERLVVGRVVRSHGLRGEVLVQVLSDSPERFAVGSRFDAGDPEAEPLRELIIAAARLAQGRHLLRFDGVDDRAAADALRGAILSIPFSDARDLDDGEYWPHQLVGLTVVDSEGRRRGTVADVVPGAAHDQLAVTLDEGGSVLVPTVSALVTVDLDNGKVTVAPVHGLLGEE